MININKVITSNDQNKIDKLEKKQLNFYKQKNGDAKL
jgi:hypothetical protein